MTDVHTTPAIVLDCDIRSQQGVIQPLGRKGVPIIALSSKQDCPAFHSRYVRKKIISPSLNDNEEEYIQFLTQLPEKGVLIYSNDLSAVAISKHQQRLKDSGFLLNISENRPLESVFDKWGCYQLAQSLGIPMAKSHLVSSLEEIYEVWDDFEKPVLLKGTRMAGGEYPKISTKEEIPEAWKSLYQETKSSVFKARKSDIILQEWHSYDMTDNWSCETVFTKKSEPIGFFTIKRIRCSLNADGTFSSQLHAGHYEHNQQLIDYTKTILASLNWKGFAHVEYFYVPKKKQFLLTEVNPRLPGYSYYPGAAGFNMAYYYYTDLTGVKLSGPTTFPESTFFTSFLFPGDITAAFSHIPKGHIKLLPFIKSYLTILHPGHTKVFDSFMLDDPKFSVRVQLGNMQRFFQKVSNFIKKRIPFF